MLQLSTVRGWAVTTASRSSENNMREIKFRAWNGRMIIEPFNNTEYASLNNAIEACRKRMNLMQFTRLKDKNGLEIYEGDIIADGEGKE